MPQPSGSFGGQVGTGNALVFAETVVAEVEATLVRVEAIAPVRARATTKVRMNSFILG